MSSSPAPPSSPREGAPSPLTLRVNDTTICCVCPPGTIRLAGDISFLLDDQKQGVSWVHLPCRPHNALESVSTTASGAPGALARLLGPDPSPAALRKVQNFTSKFICDGPCNGFEVGLKGWFPCKRCLAWQHTECMLYGEKGDAGGPVCNHCYVDVLIHHDRVRRWQRRRLMECIQEAFVFLTDDDTSHEIWRRAWLQKFTRRFMSQNQGFFIRSVRQRRYQQMVAPYLFPVPAHARQQPVRQGAVEQQVVDTDIPIKEEPADDDDVDEAAKDRRMLRLWNNTTIHVSNPFTKIATRQPRLTKRQMNRKQSPLRKDGTRRSHHRKRPPKPEDAPPPRERKRSQSALSSSGSALLDSEDENSDYENKDGQSAARKRRMRNQLVGAGTARKSVRMSEAMKKSPPKSSKKALFMTDDEDSAANGRGSDQEMRDGDDDEDSGEDEGSAALSPVLKETKKNYMLGTSTPRKSINMAKAMKKTVRFSVDNEEQKQDDQEMDDENEDEESASPSPVLKGTKRNYMIGTSTPRKSINMAKAMKKNVRFSVENDEQYQDDEVALSLEKAIGNKDGRATDDEHSMEDQLASIDSRVGMSASPTDNESICCKCINVYPTADSCFACSQCDNLQHKECAASGQIGLRPFCNSCLRPAKRRRTPEPVTQRSSKTNQPAARQAEASVIQRPSETEQPPVRQAEAPVTQRPSETEQPPARSAKAPVTQRQSKTKSAARPAKAPVRRRQTKSGPSAIGKLSARSSGSSAIPPQNRIDIAAAIRTGVFAATIRTGVNSAAAPTPRTAAAGKQAMEAMLDEINQLSSTVLWRAYLAIPSSGDGEDTAAAPSKRPPADWQAECEDRLTHMMLSAGRDTTKGYLGAALSAFPRMPAPILDGMTEMALWMVGEGPWKGRRAELGLLGEALGMEPKGRHWQGGGS